MGVKSRRSEVDWGGLSDIVEDADVVVLEVELDEALEEVLVAELDVDVEDAVELEE